MPGGSNTPVRGLGFAFLSFTLFATHDAIIKALGQTYSVFQILFFAMLFAFIPMTVLVLADRSTGNFRPHHPWLILARSATTLISMSCAFYAFATLPLAQVYALLFATPLLITVLGRSGPIASLAAASAVPLITGVAYLLAARMARGSSTPGHVRAAAT